MFSILINYQNSKSSAPCSVTLALVAKETPTFAPGLSAPATRSGACAPVERAADFHETAVGSAEGVLPIVGTFAKLGHFRDEPKRRTLVQQILQGGRNHEAEAFEVNSIQFCVNLFQIVITILVVIDLISCFGFWFHLFYDPINRYSIFFAFNASRNGLFLISSMTPSIGVNIAVGSVTKWI